MAQPLNPGRLAGRALRGVRTTALGAEVQQQRLLARQFGQLLGAVHHTYGEARRVEQIDHPAAARHVGVPHGRARRPGQPLQVGPLGRTEHGADEARGPPAPDHHARRAGEGAPQPQLLLRAGGDLEAEVAGEDLRPVQIRLLELQPGQVGDLDHGVPGPAGVLAP